MASSAVSCASQSSCSDLYEHITSQGISPAKQRRQHEALMDIVATAQHLAESGALSVSGTGATQRKDAQPAVHSVARGFQHGAQFPVAYDSPLEQQRLLPQQHLTSWQSLWHAQQHQKQQVSSKAPARRCLCLDVNSSKSAATSPGALQPQAPFTPVSITAAADCGSCCARSSSSRSRMQEWLGSMELKLQIPATPMLPIGSPCPAPKGPALANSRKRPSAAEEAAGSLLAEFQRTSKRSSSMLQDQRSVATVDTAAAAAVAAESQSAAGVANLAAAQIAAAVGGPQVEQGAADGFSGDNNNKFDAMPPPAFVILGIMSRQQP